MDNVLIVSEKEETRSRLSALLATLPQVRVQAAVDAESAMSCAQGADPALVLIAAPLDGTEKLCRGLLDNTYASVVLLCTKGTPPDGVIALADSIAPPQLLQLLQITLQSRRRFLGLRTENAALHNKLSELRLVNRAKCVLIQYLGIGEAQAHRYIEKQAMDRRMSRTEIAREILKTYEL